MEEQIFINYKYTNNFDLENSDSPAVEEIFGEIFIYDDEDVSTNIGNIELHLYNFSFSDLGYNLYDAFDRSGSTMNLGFAILDLETYSIKDEIYDQIGYSSTDNILVIHNFMLFDKFRNKGIGKKIIKGIELFFKGKCGFIALQSYPKQHDITLKGQPDFDEYKLYNLDRDIDKAQISLNSFYENCDYVKVEGSNIDIYIKNIDPF